MLQIPQEAFSAGLLSKSFHDRLIADLPQLSAKAGIPPKFVWAPLSQYCQSDDLAWVRSIRDDETAGLAYIGKTNPTVETKMMAITGACMRNYIDARLMTVQDVLSRLKADNMPSPTVLLVPNFCLDKAEGGDIPSWQVSSLLGLLYGRMAKGLKTVLYCGSLAALEKSYGQPFREHIESHYTIVT